MSKLFFTRKLMRKYENTILTRENWNYVSKKKFSSTYNFTTYEYIFTSKNNDHISFARVLFYFPHYSWIKFLSYEDINPIINIFTYNNHNKAIEVTHVYHDNENDKEQVTEYLSSFYSLDNEYFDDMRIPLTIKKELSFHSEDYYLNFPLVKHYYEQNNYNSVLDVVGSASECVMSRMKSLPHMDNELMHIDNIHDFTYSLFKSRRRDLIKAVAQSDVVTLSIAKAIYHKTMPLEKIIYFLQENKNIDVYLENNMLDYPSRSHIIKDIYQIKHYCKQSVLLSIMKEYTNFWNNNHPKQEESDKYFMMMGDLSDTVTMLQLLHVDKKYLIKVEKIKTQRGVTNYKAYHDAITKIYNEYLIEHPKTYSFDDNYYLEKNLRKNKKIISNIEKQSHDNVNYLVARKPNDLAQWGSQMQHCIGSYDYEMINGSSILGAIIINNNMIGNFQLTKKMGKWKLEQLLGKRNGLLEKEHLDIIEKDLRKVGVIIRKYLGKQ